MLAPDTHLTSSDACGYRLAHSLLPAEQDFYQAYEWCLNPHLTVTQAARHLRTEIDRIGSVPNDWRLEEVLVNIFLLGCGLLNSVDEHLRGPGLHVPNRWAATPVARRLGYLVEWTAARPGARHRARLRPWRERWLSDLNLFLRLFVAGAPWDPPRLSACGSKLKDLLDWPLPSDLSGKRLAIPTPFSRLDLTHHDVVALGHELIERFPARSQPILLIGLRTSGSYFAPLVRAVLESGGYSNIELLTLEPNKGAGQSERKQLTRFAALGYLGVILDDPPHSGGTILGALDLVRDAGFPLDKLKVLVSVQGAVPNGIACGDLLISLGDEHWRKRALLEPGEVEMRLQDYFRDPEISSIGVVPSARADGFNQSLQDSASAPRSTRLKRVFEVRLTRTRGPAETRYVVAKSVGWGWFGYHAFLIGQRLSEFVPPILGLRDGILYSEWLPQGSSNDSEPQSRHELIDVAASYIAARVGRLRLATSANGMNLQRRSNGFRVLEKSLSRAYGKTLVDTLARARLRRALASLPCPHPTLIDGNMRRSEWIDSETGPRKTDFEHHGLGKVALNLTDPAYDLADTILHFRLTPEEEEKLLRRYTILSGDAEVRDRLFVNKLIAGIWSLSEVQEQLFAMRRGSAAQQVLHHRFMDAWNFLTVQAARHCGRCCRPPTAGDWRAPLVGLDLDGVLDQRTFGFPATSAAGIEALSVLHDRGLSVALNTARSAVEVREYCRAYALAGGIAEHGAYLWDAVRERSRVLINPEAVRELDALRNRLREIPGVFLDDRHQYSVRAFMYQERPRSLLGSLTRSLRAAEIGDGALAPLPTLLVQQVVANLGLDHISFHHTAIDTTFVDAKLDKGTGLCALRDWVLEERAETIAVGDNTADLPAFRAATRSFAPANVNCAREASLLGCQIVTRPYQRGFLQIARLIANGDRRPRTIPQKSGGADLFLDLLRIADRHWAANLIAMLLDVRAFKVFLR